MSILGIFDIARSALMVTKSALDTTAHNVANASTPGYTRQDVVLESVPSGAISSVGTTGRGVRTAEVKRLYDSFVNTQLKTENSNLSYWDTYSQGVVRVENIFNEASDNGISPAITDFFNAWQDVAQSPEGAAQRSLLTQKAGYLTTRLSGAYSSLADERTEIFKNSQSLVNQANSLATQIADLNEKIAGSPGALDLQDKRDSLLQQLNQIVKANNFEDNAGRQSVMINGTPIVDGSRTFTMSVATDSNDNLRFFVDIKDPYGAVVEQRDVTSSITGGQLKASIDLRDNTLMNYMNRINTFSINLADQVNYYHRQGYGLDNSTGNNFFNSPLASVTDPNKRISSVSVSSPTIDNFTVDGTNKTIMFDSGSGPTAVTLTEGTYTSDELAAELRNKLESADGVADKYTVTYDKGVKKFTIQNLSSSASSMKLLWSNSGATARQLFGFSSDSNIAAGGNPAVSDVSAVAKSVDSSGYIYDKYRITYLPVDAASGEGIKDYTVTDLTTGKSMSAVLSVDPNGFGRTLTFNGIQVRLDGNLSALGETFDFQLGMSAARELAVTVTDPQQVAASVDTFTIDNSNNSLVFDEGSFAGNVTAVLNPGAYTGDELAAEVKRSMEAADPNVDSTYTVSYNQSTKKFRIANDIGNSSPLVLSWASSTARTELGFTSVVPVTVPLPGSYYNLGNSQVTGPFTVTGGGNNAIVFQQNGGAPITASIAAGTYATGDQLAAAVKTALDNASAAAGSSDRYTVTYNAGIQKFIIMNNSGNKQLSMDWGAAGTTAGGLLGFNAVNVLNIPPASSPYDLSDMQLSSTPFTVSAGPVPPQNNTIVFSQGAGAPITATIAATSYATGDDLAAAVKSALDNASAGGGNGNSYTVTYNAELNKLVILNNPGNANLNLLWSNAGTTAAGLIGFDNNVDTLNIPPSSSIAPNYAESDNAVSGVATQGVPGDNRNAKLLADLVNQKVVAGSTPTDYYRQMVSDAGVETSSAQQSEKFQSTLVDELNSRREGLSGVSLDEEAANLIKYQKSFEAAAKMISVADQLLTTLLGMTGK